MNRFFKIFTVSTMIFFVHTATGYTDTVLLRNGDRLTGEIKNEYFVVHGSYSQIIVNKNFCKNLSMDPDRSLFGSLKTINNDLFSGTLLSREIRILLADDTLETILVKNLRSLSIELSGSSRQALTTIFTMSDGDRFSGKMLKPAVGIRNEYMTAEYKIPDINRIDFAADAPDLVKLLLVNGDIVQGNLLIDEILIEPDSIARLSAHRSKFSSIQFNSRKMLLKVFEHSSSSGPDADQDGVPDNADSCRDTPWGNQVDENGCSTDKIAVNTAGELKPEGVDEDGDGVPDYMDKCPLTPMDAEVDEKGCWTTHDILFDFDSYLLKSSHHSVLENVLAVLTKNPGLRIEIQGSTDNIGTSEYNQTLSEQRARAVKTYLVEKGIDPARLSAVGYGSARKAASNETATGRALNRRIDFQVME